MADQVRAGTRGRTDNAITRTMARAATALHRALLKISSGRLGANIAGNQVIVLTTTGRTSGKARDTTIFGYPDRADWLVVASNGGAAELPQWLRNLLVDPRGAVTIAGIRSKVTACVLTSEERAVVWPRLTASYSSFRSYERKTDREIPVVRLTPVTAP